MRVLIVDTGKNAGMREREPKKPLSFFFSPDLRDADGFDLVVLPAELFLSRPENLPQAAFVLAYGSASLLPDALAEGCSDYLREPWGMDELEARALRFCTFCFSLGTETYTYSRGRLQGRIADCRLPEGERIVLELLLQRLGRAVPREAFIRALPARCAENSRRLDMKLHRLRTLFSKVSGDREAGTFLVAVRNYGYLLDGKPCG